MPEVCTKAKFRILEKIMYFSLNAGVILTLTPFTNFKREHSVGSCSTTILLYY